MGQYRSQNRARTVTLSDIDVTAIIVQGKTELLVTKAEEIGKELVGAGLTKAQIRNIYGTVRQIDLSWSRRSTDPKEADEAMRQLLLLKPRLAYQAKREPSVEGLKNVLVPAIDLVKGNRENFQHLIDFFEAIVAYHTASGAKN
jgi:CRISPR-associated protein Csm2